MSDIFFQSLIDVDLWNSAGWYGTAFLRDPTDQHPPGIGFLFENVDAGRRIFADWRERVGQVDRYEEIRVSIIRGEILGLDPGYSIHISSNPSHSAQRAKENGVTLEFKTAVVVSRVHRMTPEPGSPHLGQFEKDFAKHGRYVLLPVSSTRSAPELNLSIEKRELHLRLAGDVTANDVDAVVFPEHYFDSNNLVQ